MHLREANVGSERISLQEVKISFINLKLVHTSFIISHFSGCTAFRLDAKGWEQNTLSFDVNVKCVVYQQKQAGKSLLSLCS